MMTTNPEELFIPTRKMNDLAAQLDSSEDPDTLVLRCSTWHSDSGETGVDKSA